MTVKPIAKHVDTLPQPWIQGAAHECRPPGDFPGFPSALPDSEGRLDYWLENVTVVPLYAAEWRCRRDWKAGPRTLNDTLWYWFEDSGGWYRIGRDGPRERFRAGDLLLIPQGQEHTVELSRAQGVRHLSAHFHAYLFGSIAFLTALGFPICIPARDGSPYAEASAALARESAVQSPGWKRAMASTIFMTLLHILRHEGPLFRPPSSSFHRFLPRLLPALEHIDTRLHVPSLAVGDLARKAGVSEVYLRRLFRQVTGMGPAAFIQRRRVEQACRLLRLTSKSIKAVAAETGFSDPAFFYRVFARWTRTTPARYQAGKEEGDSIY